MKIQEEAGFRSRELQQLVPHLNPDGLEGGRFGPDDGFLDRHEMCTFLAEKVRMRRGNIFQFCQLVGVTRRNGDYRLDTSKGEIDCDFVVRRVGPPQLPRFSDRRCTSVQSATRRWRFTSMSRSTIRCRG